MKSILIVMYLLFSFSLQGQMVQLDSLKGLPDNTSKEDVEEQLEALHAFGNVLFESAVDSAIQVGKEGLALAEKHELVEKQISFHSLLASSYGRKGLFHEAIEHFEKLVDFYEARGKEDALINTYIKIGDYYTRLDPEKSMPFFNKALSALKNKDKPQLLGLLHQSMGVAFYYRNNHHQAGTHLERAIKANLRINSWDDLCSNHNILGLIRQEEGQLDQAEQHFLKALELAEIHQFNYSKIGILANLGRFFSAAKKQPRKGAEYLKPAYETALQAGYNHRAARILLSLSGAYFEMEDNHKAIAALKESLVLQEEMADTQMKMETLEQISELFSKEEDYKNAFDFFTQFKTLQDSLVNEQNLLNIEELEKKYKTQEQQSQIQLQDTQIQQQRSRILAISLFSLLLVALLSFIWRSNRKRKQTNIQLRELDTAKSRFFANISHELRTPLTLILGPIENAITKVKSKSAKEDLNLAHSNSKKLLTLVNEILDLSKLESRQMTLQETPVHLEKLLRRIFFGYHSLAQLRGFALSFSYHLPKDLAVELDIGKFEKVLNNLLSNAFKYSQSGGAITLRAGKENGNLKIEVSDTGKGVSSEQIEKIFDRFYQAERGNEPLQGGTGIGLAYAKEIAHLFGGQLKVESKVGEGSDFIFILPLNRTTLKPIPIKEEALSKGGGKMEPITLPLQEKKAHVLVVEDNPEMSRFLVQSLSAHFHCSTAMDGEQALQLLKTGQRPDLITSDVMMPRMDGFTFFEKVHEMEDFQKTPFILLTARAMEEDKLKGLHLGVDDYLTKPFNTKELIARIRNLLKNKKVREQSLATAEVVSEVELSHDEKLIKKAEALVLEHLSDGSYRVSDFAKDLAYSPRQLERIMKKMTGLSPVEFIREIRLQKAFNLLEQRQFATVAEVRCEVGMENASHFTKKFQERFGKNPGEIMS